MALIIIIRYKKYELAITGQFHVLLTLHEGQSNFIDNMTIALVIQ